MKSANSELKRRETRHGANWSRNCFKKLITKGMPRKMHFSKENGHLIMSRKAGCIFSGKHKLYGLKRENSILPSGLAIMCTVHCPKPVADLEIFRKTKDFYEEPSKIVIQDLEYNDIKKFVEYVLHF